MRRWDSESVVEPDPGNVQVSRDIDCNTLRLIVKTSHAITG